MDRTKLTARLFEVGLLFLIILFVFFLPNMITALKVNFFSTLLDIDRVSVIVMPDELQSDVYVANETVVVGGDNQLMGYDKEGKMIWHRELRGTDTQLRSNSQYLLIAEKTRGEVVLVDSENVVVASVRDLGRLELISFSEDSRVAVKLAGENRILLLDDSLAITGSIDIGEGEIIDLQLPSVEEVVMLSVVDLNDNRFESHVLQFDMYGRPLGISDCEGQLIYSMHMSDYQVIVTDKSMMSFNKEAQLVAEIGSPGIVNNSVSYKNRLYTSMISTLEDGSEETKLMIYSDDLSGYEEMDLPIGADGLLVNDRFIAVYVDGLVTLYDHSLKQVGKINTQLTISNIQWLDQMTLVVNDSAEILIYEIH